MTIFEDFLFWVFAIIEDDPIPYEVKNVYFVISMQNNACALSLTGSELFESPVKSHEFFPLEAHYFKNLTYNEIKDIFIAKVTVKELIEKALENADFKRIFKNKSIHLTQAGEEIDYTFKV